MITVEKTNIFIGKLMVGVTHLAVNVITFEVVMRYVFCLSTNWGFFFFKQKTAYEISEGDWSSDVCSSDLNRRTQDENPETCRKHKFRFLYAIRKAK